MGELNKATETRRPEFHWLESAAARRENYLDEFPGDVCYASIDGDRLDDSGARCSGNPVPGRRTWRRFRSCARCRHSIPLSQSRFCLAANGEGGYSSSIHPGAARSRRNCVSCWISFIRSDLRYITCTCCTGCGGARGAAERARFARELHDGAVQSLIAVEMQVDVSAAAGRGQSAHRRRTGAHPEPAARRSAEAAGTDAADEGDRRRFPAAAWGVAGYGREVSARDWDQRAIRYGPRRVGHAAACMPRDSADCAGRTGQCEEAQRSAACARAPGFQRGEMEL